MGKTGITFWERFTLVVPNCGNQSQVASKTGISNSTISGWDNAKTEPKKRHVKVLKKIYNLSSEDIEYLEIGEGLPPPTTLRADGGTPAKVGEDAAGKKWRA
jgi:transcriptional regulator with XRE-family HTH domain